MSRSVTIIGTEAIVASGDGNDSPLRIENMSRLIGITQVSGLVAGTVYLSFFTPKTSLLVTTLKCRTSLTAAAGATLTRFGIYTVPLDPSSLAINANLALAFRSADIHATFATATSTLQTITLSQDGSGAALTNYLLQAGKRYAFAFVSVGNTTMPTLVGAVGIADFSAFAPVISGLFAGQTDLPASITPAQVGQIGVNAYIAAVP